MTSRELLEELSDRDLYRLAFQISEILVAREMERMTAYSLPTEPDQHPGYSVKVGS